MLQLAAVAVMSMLKKSSLLLVSLVALTASAWAGPRWRIDRGRVTVVCPLTVGGSFDATTTQITGDPFLATPRPPRFAGEIAVDLQSLDTGINLRNRHLRENYLEVGRGTDFSRAVLSDIRLGDVDADSFQGRTMFAGTLRLHGVSKLIEGSARIQRNGSNIQIDARFPLNLEDHAIEKPRYLGVGVKSQVEVRVSLVATPAAGTPDPAEEKR